MESLRIILDLAVHRFVRLKRRRNIVMRGRKLDVVQVRPVRGIVERDVGQVELDVLPHDLLRKRVGTVRRLEASVDAVGCLG